MVIISKIGTKKRLLLVLIVFLFLFLSSASSVYAGFSIGDFNKTSGLDATGGKTGHKADNKLITPIDVTVASLIKLFLSFLGVIFLGLMIYAGFLWMTAKGNQTKIDKATSIITNSVIGLILIIAAYMITLLIRNSFVFDPLSNI